MRDYQYKGGYTDHEGEYTPPYVTGKREKVALVVESKYLEAFIVRLEDILPYYLVGTENAIASSIS